MKIFKSLLTIILCTSAINGFCTESVQESLSGLLQQRHSGYKYDASKSVSKDQLQKLVEAARTAPSSFNEQPWRFIISDRKLTPDTYNKVINSLVEFNQGWAKNAPILVVVVADSKSEKNGQDNRWAPYDTGAAAFAMMLTATDMGLMAHQMGGFDEKKIQKDLQIPDRYVPMAVMAIGYEAQGETGEPKKRKPISDNFFMGAWGQGIDSKVKELTH